MGNGRQPLRCHLPTCRIGWSSAQSSLRTYITKSGQDLVTGVPSVIISTTIRKVWGSDLDTAKFKSISFQDQPVLSSPPSPSCRHKGPERPKASYLRLGPYRRCRDGGCQTKTTMQGQRYFSGPANNHSDAIALYIARILFNSWAR